jgi:HTH-type transcriptional regulator, competence development regulator
MARGQTEQPERQTLGKFLQTIRAAKPMTLRQVEEATEGKVSNAYLSQLENDKIAKPSPTILHALATAYGTPYEKLMQLAGYLDVSTDRPHAATFAIDDLTPEEEDELLHYLRYIRERKLRHEKS